MTYDLIRRLKNSNEIHDERGVCTHVVVPVRAAPEWVQSYLTANNEYWRMQDAQACPPMRWRKGTPAEATAYAYEIAMLAAACHRAKP